MIKIQNQRAKSTKKFLSFKQFLFLFFRLNDNIPVQSQSIPVMSIYFITCMVFTILGMIWFAALYKIKEKKMLPMFMKFFVVYVLAFCLCLPKTRKKILKSFKRNDIAVDLELNDKDEYFSDDQLFVCFLSILNRFVFVLFSFFISMLNVIILFALPTMAKKYA